MSAAAAPWTEDDAPAIVELVAVPALPSVGRVGEIPFRSDAWLPAEDARLREMFAADASIDEIANAVGRRFQATRHRICALGLRRNSQRPWTPMEDAEVLRRYGPETAAAIAQDLGRGVGGVYARANLLGASEAGAPDWTAWEDAQLREGYAQGLPVAQLAVLIGRPYSAANSRAFKLGLRHKYQPPGWSAEEIVRALALAHEGHRYLQLIELLVDEGFPRRTKAGLGPVLHRMGYGRGWGRRWTQEEDDLLRQAYATGASVRALGRQLARSACSMTWRAEALGLRGTHVNTAGWRGEVWTAEEEDRLREVYGKVRTRDLPAMFGRTRSAIFVRAWSLGLKHGYWRPYDEDEVRAIRIAWRHGLSIPQVAEALGRKAPAVYKQLGRLDLDWSDPSRPAFAGRGRVANRKAWSLAEILALESPAPPVGESQPRRARPPRPASNDGVAVARAWQRRLTAMGL